MVDYPVGAATSAYLGIGGTCLDSAKGAQEGGITSAVSGGRTYTAGAVDSLPKAMLPLGASAAPLSLKSSIGASTGQVSSPQPSTHWVTRTLSGPLRALAHKIGAAIQKLIDAFLGKKIHIDKINPDALNAVLSTMGTTTPETGKELSVELLKKELDHDQFRKDQARISINGQTGNTVREAITSQYNSHAGDNLARLCTQTLLTDISEKFKELELPILPAMGNGSMAMHAGVGLSRYTYDTKRDQIIITIMQTFMTKIDPEGEPLTELQQTFLENGTDQDIWLYSQPIQVKRTITLSKEEFCADWAKLAGTPASIQVHDDYRLSTRAEIKEAVNTQKGPNETVQLPKHIRGLEDTAVCISMPRPPKSFSSVS